jgi:hypothetical protein
VLQQLIPENLKDLSRTESRVDSERLPQNGVVIYKHRANVLMRQYVTTDNNSQNMSVLTADVENKQHASVCSKLVFTAFLDIYPHNPCQDKYLQ